MLSDENDKKRAAKQGKRTSLDGQGGAGEEEEGGVGRRRGGGARVEEHVDEGG